MISGDEGLFKRTNESVLGYENAEQAQKEAMATLMKYFSGTLDLTGSGVGEGTTTINEEYMRLAINTLITDALVEKLGYVAAQSDEDKLFARVDAIKTKLNDNLDSISATLREKADITTTTDLQNQINDRATTTELQEVSDKINDTATGNQALYAAILNTENEKSLINRISANEEDIETNADDIDALEANVGATANDGLRKKVSDLVGTVGNSNSRTC